MEPEGPLQRRAVDLVQDQLWSSCRNSILLVSWGLLSSSCGAVGTVLWEHHGNSMWVLSAQQEHGVLLGGSLPACGHHFWPGSELCPGG